ncbi:SsgA family sporulation/cell division regulator [Kitasatospora sp. NPDC096147]|uniref:SsgA family sporulation/cell division regulator n=1 Tax=Kitasatospora sp. NPDC096147 TaxID=3364093 RepID=UPI003814CD16
MDTSRTTTLSLTVRVLSGPHTVPPLEGRLTFDTALPYAVYLGVSPGRPFTGGEPPVCWTFARDLLARGRRVPSGEGDILIAPGPHGLVLVELRGAAGHAVLGLPAARVEAFLEDAFALVPLGSESDHLDLDACLERLRG